MLFFTSVIFVHSLMLQILLLITVGLKELLVIFPPLNEWRTKFGVTKGQTGEYCCFSRLYLQSLWG